MKTLLIMRHAKSDNSFGQGSDFERPLNERGYRTAPFMGKYLKEKGLTPDYIISSPANRAITTAELVAENCAYTEQIKTNRGFYSGNLEQVISEIREVPADIDTVMIFGHNPTWENLVSRLSGEFISMATATIVVLKFPSTTWETLTFQSCTLEDVFVPRELMV